MMPSSLLVAAAVLFSLTQGGLAVTLNPGDVFTGMFELGGLTDDNYFVLRAHSPIQGAFTWITGLGHAPGWMTHCTPPSRSNSCFPRCLTYWRGCEERFPLRRLQETNSMESNSCAGGELTRPVFGTLNVTGVGECTGGTGGCTGPPALQPASGCNAYGCWVRCI